MNPLPIFISAISAGVAGAIAWSALWTVLLPGRWDGHESFLLMVFVLSAMLGALGPFLLRR